MSTLARGLCNGQLNCYSYIKCNYKVIKEFTYKQWTGLLEWWNSGLGRF